MNRLYPIVLGVLLLAGALAPLATASSRATSGAVTGVAASANGTIALPQSMALFTVRKLEGDVTGDCAVRIDDDQSEGLRFGTRRGSLLYSPQYDVNLPYPDNLIDPHDLQFVVGRNGSTCAAPIPPQPPIEATSTGIAAPVTLTKDPPYANIWFCDPGVGSCGAALPTRIDARNWQNGVIIDEVLTITNRTRINGYQFELRFDPTIFRPPAIVDQGALGSGTACTTDAPAYGTVTFRCTSAAGPLTWDGPRTVARVTLLVNRSLDQTIRPAKENGLISPVYDAGTISTPFAPTTTPTAAPSVTSTAPATRTALATATVATTTTAVRTQTPQGTTTPRRTGTPPSGTRTAEPTGTGTASPSPVGTGSPPPAGSITAVPTETLTPNTAVPTVTDTPFPSTSASPASTVAPGSRTPPPQASGTSTVAGATAPAPLPSVTPTQISSVLSGGPRPPVSTLPGTGSATRYQWWDAAIIALMLSIGGWAVVRTGWELWLKRAGRR